MRVPGTISVCALFALPFVLVTFSGCAHRNAQEARLSTALPSQVMSAPAHTPAVWSHRHRNHRHTTPYYKDRDPVVPVDARPICKVDPQRIQPGAGPG